MTRREGYSRGLPDEERFRLDHVVEPDSRGLPDEERFRLDHVVIGSSSAGDIPGGLDKEAAAAEDDENEDEDKGTGPAKLQQGQASQAGSAASKRKQFGPCKCGAPDHSRTNFRGCPLNKKSKQIVEVWGMDARAPTPRPNKEKSDESDAEAYKPEKRKDSKGDDTAGSAAAEAYKPENRKDSQGSDTAGSAAAARISWDPPWEPTSRRETVLPLADRPENVEQRILTRDNNLLLHYLQVGKQRTCVMCGKRATHECVRCHVVLHMTHGPESCFNVWHTEESLKTWIAKKQSPASTGGITSGSVSGSASGSEGSRSSGVVIGPRLRNMLRNKLRRAAQEEGDDGEQEEQTLSEGEDDGE